MATLVTPKSPENDAFKVILRWGRRGRCVNPAFFPVARLARLRETHFCKLGVCPFSGRLGWMNASDHALHMFIGQIDNN